MTKVRSDLARLVLLFGMALVLPVLAGQTNSKVTLHLKNGDQLTGEVLSEDANRVVLSTPWNVAIFVPKSEIEKQVVPAPPPETPPVQPTPPPDSVAPVDTATASTSPEEPRIPADPVAQAASVAPTLTKAPAPPEKPKDPKRWKWDLKLGTEIISGAVNRQNYSGQTTFTYTRNYQSNPRQFLRNKTEYRIAYGETDDQVSANSMAAANKLDFGLFNDFYGYAALGGGYDRVRKIEYQLEVGPGIGYHLLARKSLVVDVETGLNYQYREGLGTAPNRELFQTRIAQDLTWQVAPKITFSESVAFLSFIQEAGQFQLRAEGNLGFGIVRHLSLNLTVMNLYDTQPAPGVPNNELQFRSSLGVNF